MDNGIDIKITDLEVVELCVPGGARPTSDGSYDDCLVFVHTDAGVTRITEVDTIPGVMCAIIDAQRSHSHTVGLSAAILGQDALHTAAL